MNYKYYIYKQGTSGVNFDKYNISNYIFLKEIRQNSKWSLKIERDNEWFTIIRKKFNGEITVKGDDFDTLIALEETYIQYAIIIYRECAGVYSEFWKGFFSYFDFKVDLDRCYLTFEPTVWDEYSNVFDQFPIERNVLTAAVGTDIYMAGFEWEYESITYSYIEDPLLYIPAYWHEYNWNPTFYPVGNRYYLYKKTTTLISWNNPTATWKASITLEYRRDYAISTSNLVPPPGTAPPGMPEWDLDPCLPGPGEYGPGTYKWVRPYLNSNFTTYSAFFFPVTYITNYETLLVTPSTPIWLHGCVPLNSILEYFADYINITYVSDFFNLSPCPMGGTTLNLTMIQQISNIRSTAEQATRGMMKLKDLLSWIRDTFNVYWYIDSSGDWRLEHRKYFDMGLSYTAYAGIEMDLDISFPDSVYKLRRYEWLQPKLYRFEKIEFPYSYSPDWIDGIIEYPQYSILGNESNTKMVEWGTDVIMMYEQKDDLPKVGWILLNVDWVDHGGLAIRDVINTPGALSTNSFQNARFSTANLLRDLWTWGRIMPTGEVNGILTTFKSIEKLKQQVEISIPQCCTDINYNGIFRTKLGDGILYSAEYDETGMLKIQLLYE